MIDVADFNDEDKLGKGNAITRLTLSKINKLSFVVPKLKEQKAIAKALSDVDALIEAQEKLIAKKQAIKTATIQQLLTGKTRLIDNGKLIMLRVERVFNYQFSTINSQL